MPASKDAEPIKQVIEQKDTEVKSIEGLKKLIIRIDGNEKVAKLIIPNSIVRKLNGDLDKTSFVPLRFENGGQPAMSRIGTVVGGLLLTLSFVFGGLWLMRNRKMSASNLSAMLLILSLSGVGTTSLVFANAGPPPEVRSLTGRIFSIAVHSYKYASGELRIETSNDVDYLELRVPDSK